MADRSDLSDLPPKLIKELSTSASGASRFIDALVDELIEDNPTVDALLIALWRSKNIVYRRSHVSASIARLKALGRIERIGTHPENHRVAIYARLTRPNTPEGET